MGNKRKIEMRSNRYNPGRKFGYYTKRDKNRVMCFCPKCEKLHLDSFEYPYSGNMKNPWKICGHCLKTISDPIIDEELSITGIDIGNLLRKFSPVRG